MDETPQVNKKPHAHANTRHEGLREFMIKNEMVKGLPAYKSVAQIAEMFGVSQQYLYRVRQILTKKGLLKHHTSAIGEILTSDPGVGRLAKLDPEGLLKLVENEVILSPLDRLKILSRLVRTGAPALKIQAIKTLEELGRTAEQRVGPPVPMTLEDRIARLGRLLLAIGEETSSKAFEVTFGYAPTSRPLSPAETIQPNGSGFPESDGIPGGEMRDMPDSPEVEPLPSSGPFSPDGSDPGPSLREVQPGASPLPGQPSPPP